MPEAYSRLEAQSWDSIPSGDLAPILTFQAEVTAAQLSAVYAGRKPAFIEPELRMVRPFAEHLPPGIHYVEAGGHGCIYNEAAVARELGIAPEPELHAAVRDAVAGEDFGLLLGYGAPSIFTRPSHQVTISRNGSAYYGFNSSANAATAEHCARERMRDFEIAFPDDKWESKIDLRPGSDTLHAANPYGCNGAGHKPGCPQKGTTREPLTKGTPHRVHKVNQTHPIHKQISALAEALERAARDGTRLEAVIYRPEFGKLILSCGSSQKNGVTHVMLPRHHISYSQVAETLLKGEVTAHPYKESRLEIKWDKYLVVLEREIKQNSHRTSKTRAKLHTAYNVVDGKE